MSIVKILVVVFCVVGSSVLFFSIGKVSNSHSEGGPNIENDDSLGTIIFHVTNGNNQTIKEAVVLLQKLEATKIHTAKTTTDVLGYAQFDSLKPGKYQWKITTNKLNKVRSGLIELSISRQVEKEITFK